VKVTVRRIKGKIRQFLDSKGGLRRLGLWFRKKNFLRRMAQFHKVRAERDWRIYQEMLNKKVKRKGKSEKLLSEII